jgi:hypothetical protein
MKAETIAAATDRVRFEALKAFGPDENRLA